MTEKKAPTPEDVQKEIEEMMREKFGESVQFMTSAPKTQPDKKPEPEVPKEPLHIEFDLKPKDIKDHLDQYVIKQDEAKKALAIAICDHYNHVKDCLRNPENRSANYSKQNILLMGPTGVGKTYLVKQVAKLIGVPFVKADATRFSETGYVGANVDDLVKDLVSQAEGNLELAQYGIIYLDEADKLASPQGIMGKDISGRGVQIGLLKLMEETEVNLRGGNDITSQIQAMMDFQRKGKVEKKTLNTRHILFIVSGAFSGLEDIIKTRLKEGTIGLNSHGKKSRLTHYFPFTKTKDLTDFGFEPEFIGRLPIRVSCEPLNEDDLFHILTEAKDSLLHQYEASFKAYGISVFFAESGLRAIARQAHQEKTGARALMTVFEKALRSFKYELPSRELTDFVVTEKLIQDPHAELKKILSNPEYNFHLVTQEKLKFFEKFYRTQHKLNIKFTESAAALISQRAFLEKTPPLDLCKTLLEGYEHGLSLIHKNTGKDFFELDQAFVKDPKKTLEVWIQQSYQAT